MNAALLGALAAPVLGALFLLRRAAARSAAETRWTIVERRGPYADFRCGHRARRHAAFGCGGLEGIFIRKIPRWMSGEVACPDCVLERLSGKTKREAAGFEGLVPLDDALAEISLRQKNRPE